MGRLPWFDRQLRALKFPTARAYAQEFEITQRTAYRDVEYLEEQMQLPIGSDSRRREYYYTESNAPLSPMVAVSAGDLVAVYIAQWMLEQYQETQFGTRLGHAFEKISSLLTDEVSIHLASLRDGFSFHVEPSGRLAVPGTSSATALARGRPDVQPLADPQSDAATAVVRARRRLRPDDLSPGGLLDDAW